MNRFFRVLVFWTLLISGNALAQPGLNDMTFNPNDVGFGQGDGTVNTVYSTILQTDGKILISGSFLSYNAQPIKGIARINADGLIDNTFNTGTGPTGNVYKMVLQPDGKIIICGDFTAFNGVSKNRMARLNTDGSLDASFSTSFSYSSVNEIALQPDGKILIEGGVGNVIRLNANGSTDNTFSMASGAWGDVKAIVIQPDNKIILGGDVLDRIVRLNSNGSIDNTFNAGTGMNAVVNTVSLQPDGKIIAGGDFTLFDGNLANRLIRLNPDGSADNSFDTGNGVGSTVLATTIQANGQILISGFFSTYNNASVLGIARINPDGSLDPSFNSGSTAMTIPILSINIQSDGKIIIGGNFEKVDNDPIRGLARLNVNGTVDPTFNFNTSANHFIYTMGVQSNNKVIIGGDFTSYDEVPLNRIARLNINGSIDPTFDIGSGFDYAPKIIVIQSDGKILVGGDFSYYKGLTANKLVRLNPDGSRDNTFNADANGNVRTISIQPDGKILVGGLFITFNGVSANRLIRLNADGSTDNSFNIGTAANDWVYSTAIQSDGKILVGGMFTTFNGVNANRIVRLNTDGSIDNTFNMTGANNTVYIIKIQPDGKILVGGMFTSFNTSAINRIVRLETNGALDLSFNPGTGTNNEVRTIQVQQNGNLFVGGYFTIYNGSPCNYFMSLTSTGQLDNSFNFGSGANGSVWYSEILTPGKILISGGFTAFNGAGRNRIARILDCYPSAGSQTISNCGTYFWPVNGQMYVASGQYTHTIPNTAGCDSIITLNLTINTPPDTVIDNQIVCDSFSWIDGNTYISSTNTPTVVLQNAAGCDSIIVLNLTILNSSNSSETQTACGSFLWPVNGQTYTTSGQYIDTIPNTIGCDSIITLDLTIIPELPLTISNSFSMPSDANSCVGEAAITVSGNADFELDVDNGSQVVTSNGYSLITNLCAGIHDLHVTDYCGDTLSTQIVIPVDSNYVFNNPFIDSLAIDSLGVTVTNCDIYYAGIDTAYIDSIWANGNTVNVIWNIVDSNGSNFDTTSYVLNSGNGVYWLQLSVFCPNKSVGEYFAVTEAIYFNNGSVSTAGLSDYKQRLFEVFPNPTANQVTINFSGSDAELTVYDLQGKVVLRDSIQNQGMVSLENFERGVYLFDLRNSNGKSIQRVVKQ